MDTTQLVIFDHHKKIQLSVERMAVYLQSKIIEAYDEHNQVYYVFFYKDHYLTAAKTSQLKRNSHMEHAFKNGVIFHYHHPFVRILTSSDQIYNKRTFNQVITKMENIFSPHELAHIATIFESFIPKKKLFAYIQNLFYEYRRNGQMFLCYRIIRILMDFAPKHSWVKEISSHLDFIKFAKLYQQQADILLEKDPIFAEKVLSLQLYDLDQFKKLTHLLDHQKRWTDLIAIHIQSISIYQHEDHFHSLLHLLQQHFQGEQIVEFLEDLSEKTPGMTKLQQLLLEKYVNHHQFEKVINLLSSHNLTLNKTQVLVFEKMLEEYQFEESNDIQIEKLNSFLIPFFTLHPEKAEKFLQNWIMMLLKKDYDLAAILDLLVPLKQIKEAIPILVKIEKMHKLADDPDQQLLLGQLYYQFKQYDQAIECFSWEMELKSIDPKPVQWLSKIYNELGMKQEYLAYQKLCIDMQKRA